jgi:flagellar biosynthesis anti-sigma factor FlgM
MRAARPGPSPEALDRAGITEDARELARGLEAVRSGAEVRELRIAALRKAIAEGHYQPDPREIARALVERGFDRGERG